MPKNGIDLAALERIIGRPPLKYAKGHPRNSARARWFQRAARIIGRLAAHSDRERASAESRKRETAITICSFNGGRAPVADCACTPCRAARRGGAQ